MKKRKCEHPLVRYTWGLRHHQDGTNAPDVALAVHCTPCGTRLSLGPSNDADVPADEIIAAVCAHSDADHAAFGEDGYDWDVTKPLAEQWPWSGEKLCGSTVPAVPDPTMLAMLSRQQEEAHAALTGRTDQGQPVNAFEPVDYASTQPWADPSASTRLTDAELIETVAYCPPGSVRE